MNFARAVRIARAARGISQKELAERAGLDASYVSRIEFGERTPRQKAVASLASALQVPVDLLRLLAAPKEGLGGITQAEAGVIGAMLLELLTTEAPR